ncbi:MAG: nickel-responsive transcriptional regulator NikR [Gammaproteobacteria bacterium]|nr:nickel-responsive transcriptional regulator NikR [Gammaproteobacteria bacterium]
MSQAAVSSNSGVARISVSLPEELLMQLDGMVAERGFESRSQAIADMINHQLTEHREELGQDIMAGTINIVYDHSIPGVQKQLSDLQHEYIDEVISALNVNLEQKQTMAVILVQGPARKLKMIANRMTTCRGVRSGKLLMSTAIIPQLHPLPEADMKQV